MESTTVRKPGRAGAAALVRRRLSVAGAVAGCAALFALAPPEASVWGSTGLLLGVGMLGLGFVFASLALRAARRRRFWRFRQAGAPWAVLALCAVFVGAATVVGNFQVIRIAMTIDQKGVTAQASSRMNHTYGLTAVGRSDRVVITRGVYEAVQPGDRVRCTGVNSPLMGRILTRCVLQERTTGANWRG